MNKKIWVLPLILIVMFIAGIGAKTASTRLQRTKRPAYTITWQATEYFSSGEVMPLFTEVRHVSQNGNWHSIMQYADGERVDLFGEVGRGTFAKRGEKLHFLSTYNTPRPL